MKQNNNLMYYYSCGCDVDHNRWKYQPNNRNRTHIPNVSLDEEHTIAVASMKSQHNTLPDILVAGKVWILAQQLLKLNQLMEQQDTWRNQHQQQQCRGWRLGATGLRTDKIDKHNLEPTSVDSLYPTQQNNCNIFVLLTTDEDYDGDNKTTIINNQTPKTMEAA